MNKEGKALLYIGMPTNIYIRYYEVGKSVDDKTGKGTDEEQNIYTISKYLLLRYLITMGKL